MRYENSSAPTNPELTLHEAVFNKHRSIHGSYFDRMLVVGGMTTSPSGFDYVISSLSESDELIHEDDRRSVVEALAQTGEWLQGMGRVDGVGLAEPSEAEVTRRLTSRASAFGRLAHVGSPVRMTETPPRWDRAPVPLGTHPASWAQA